MELIQIINYSRQY